MLRTALTLALVLAGLLAPALAQPAASPAPETAPQLSAPPATVGEASLGTPAPTPVYGIKYGPCSVSVNCGGGIVIGCGGQNRCTWKYQPNGFVECDGVRTDCPLF